MEAFNLYKHVNNTDVAMCPVRIFYSKERKGYAINCYWFNIVNPKNEFLIDLSPRPSVDHVFVKEEDMSKWKLWRENVSL